MKKLLFAFLFCLSFPVYAVKMDCDQLAGWIYTISGYRDQGAPLEALLQAIDQSNPDAHPDVVLVLKREAGRLYLERKSGLDAAIDVRNRCRAVKGQMGRVI